VAINTGSLDVDLIKEIIELTGASLLDSIKEIPIVAAHPGAWEAIVKAGQLAYTAAYKHVYYVSIGEKSTNRTTTFLN
jgi:hypothetical protein